jgi:excinuclease ABC subunit B
MTAGQLMEKVSALEKEMFEYARDLEFEKAASLRDEVETLRAEILKLS